jgi:hypothetical protein
MAEKWLRGCNLWQWLALWDNQMVVAAAVNLAKLNENKYRKRRRLKS